MDQVSQIHAILDGSNLNGVPKSESTFVDQVRCLSLVGLSKSMSPGVQQHASVIGYASDVFERCSDVPDSTSTAEFTI